MRGGGVPKQREIDVEERCPLCHHALSVHWTIGAHLCSVGQGSNRSDLEPIPCPCPGLPPVQIARQRTAS